LAKLSTAHRDGGVREYHKEDEKFEADKGESPRTGIRGTALCHANDTVYQENFLAEDRSRNMFLEQTAKIYYPMVRFLGVGDFENPSTNS